MSETMSAQTLQITGHGGDEIEAYLACPDGPPSRGGVVLIHHLPGYDRATREMVRRFATLGYDTLCPNLYSREAPGLPPDEAYQLIRERGGVPDAQLVGDVAGAAAHLRALPSSNGKVGVIGFCSGGRQSVLAACRIDLDAAVDCWGGFVVGEVPAGMPFEGNIEADLPNLGCPVLGLFGNDDSNPAPADVDYLDSLLNKYGKVHEFHRYDGAGHAFFNTDRDAFRAAAAADGWQRIETFYGRHLRTD